MSVYAPTTTTITTTTLNLVSSSTTETLQSTSIMMPASSSNSITIICSQISCRNGCTFSQTSCKCMNDTSNTECQLTTASDTQQNDDTSMETWKMALLIGCSVFLVLFIIIFIYFKKRQHRGRGFNIPANNLSLIHI